MIAGWWQSVGVGGGKRMPRCPFVLLVYILLAILSQAGLGLAQLFVQSVAFRPALPSLRAHDSATLSLEVAYYYHPSLAHKLARYQLDLAASTADPAIASADYRNDSLQFSANSLFGQDDDDDDGAGQGDGVVLHTATPLPPDLSFSLAYHRTNLTIHGQFIGKTVAFFKPHIYLPDEPQDRDKDKPFNTSLPIIIRRSRHSKTLNAIFLSTLGCLIMLANVMMGCELNLSVVADVIRRPVAPGIGFACQFLAMPLVSFALARTMLVPWGELALGLGLFTAGCAPGGGASNFWTVLLDGNADLSITMTFISTIAAFAMMPLWMWALGDSFLAASPGVDINIPYKNILISLSILVGPLLIGILIKRYLPKAAEMVRKIMRPFLILIIVFIVSFGTYANLYMFRLMSWRVLVGGLLLPFCGFWLGCFAALAARQPAANVAAIAIETGVQNSGIAIMLLKLSFPEPDGDIASVAPVVVSIFTPVPLLIGYSVHLLMAWIKKRRCPDDDDDDQPEPAATEKAPLANGRTPSRDDPPGTHDSVQVQLLAATDIRRHSEKA